MKEGTKPKLLKIKKNDLPDINEIDSPGNTQMGFFRNNVSMDEGMNEKKFRVVPRRVVNNTKPVKRLHEDFQMLKNDLNKAFVDIKDKKVNSKVEKSFSKLNKTYDHLERKLQRQKPHLYDFEDYLECMYGKDYSTDEYAIAMKAKPVELEKHELGELIKQVQKDKYVF